MLMSNRRSVGARRARAGVGGFVLRARVFEVAPDPPDRAEEDDCADEEVEAVEPCLEGLVLVPLLAEYLADVRETYAPWERAEEGVEGEARQVHARDAGGECDEGSYDGQQAA